MSFFGAVSGDTVTAPLTEPGLRHDIKAAVTEATDEGIFSALAAGWNTDRTNERIVKGAFAGTIARWKNSGKNVPLAWDHGRDARDIIGTINASSMQERDEGLFVEGTLDIQDSELAREAWRSVKRNRISLSFGYLVQDSRKAKDGVTELVSLDLYEVTLTSVPANPDARVLSAKSLSALYELPDGRVVDYRGMLDFATKRFEAQKKAARPIQIATFEC